MRRFWAGVPALFAAACATPVPAPTEPTNLALVDAARGRAVPLTLYGAATRPKPLAILSHGYGGNPTAYGFIAKALERRGFLVAAIDHELPGDPPIPTSGPPYEVRMPNWRIGAASIGFAIRELRARGLADRRVGVVLVGHSNGGDMAMLFAAEQPRLVSAVFTLDNRRHPFPRTREPRICSVRSSDQPADEGVLPTEAEQEALGMHVVRIDGLRHDDMWDGAAPAHREEVLKALAACLGWRTP